MLNRKNFTIDCKFRENLKPDPEIYTGYCIRCHIKIPKNRNRPYCRDCFETWANFGNSDYIDNYCHKCGKNYDSTINYPLCDECYWKT